MPRGISLHVGVNETDPDAFDFARLEGCVNDAAAMYYLAKVRDFSNRQLLIDQKATFDNVTAAITSAAAQLRNNGDVFLFTFSGHGTQVTDADGELFEFEDEAMVLYDRILLDDVLRRRYWPMFAPGVRVILVTDSCHNGTILAFDSMLTEVSIEHLSLGGDEMTVTGEVITATVETLSTVAPGMLRQISDEVRQRHLEKFSSFYRDLLSGLPAPVDVDASFIHLAACHDFETTPDGLPHGAFTQALLGVWQGGSFTGTYEELRVAIGVRLSLVGLGQQPFIEPELGQPLTPRFRDQAPAFGI